MKMAKCHLLWSNHKASMSFFSLLLQLMGMPGLPTYIGDCSSSGKATLTGADISLKQITKNTKLKAKIELQVCCCRIYFVKPLTRNLILRHCGAWDTNHHLFYQWLGGTQGFSNFLPASRSPFNSSILATHWFPFQLLYTKLFLVFNSSLPRQK